MFGLRFFPQLLAHLVDISPQLARLLLPSETAVGGSQQEPTVAIIGMPLQPPFEKISGLSRGAGLEVSAPQGVIGG